MINSIDAEQRANIDHIIDVLNRWKAEGIPDNSIVYLFNEGQDETVVSNISFANLLRVIDGWRGDVVKEFDEKFKTSTMN